MSLMGCVAVEVEADILCAEREEDRRNEAGIQIRNREVPPAYRYRSTSPIYVIRIGRTAYSTALQHPVKKHRNTYLKSRFVLQS